MVMGGGQKGKRGHKPSRSCYGKKGESSGLVGVNAAEPYVCMYVWEASRAQISYRSNFIVNN